MSQILGEQSVIDHGTSRSGRWLRARRTRFALWIAVLEAIIVAVAHDVSRWTVIVLAIVAVICWIAGRESRSTTVRQLLWIFAASQLLTLIAVILGWIVKWAVIMAIVVFAIVALVFLFLDRR